MPFIAWLLVLKVACYRYQDKRGGCRRMTVQGGGGVPTPQATTPSHMLCGLCGLLCKRATRIACCNAQCCWGCGIR